MSFWDKMKNFTQPYSDEDYDDYEDGIDEFEEAPQEAAAKPTRRPSPFSKIGESEPAPAAAPAAPSNSGFSGQVLNMNSGKQEVVLFHARTFDDAAKAANELRKKKAVILNMEKCGQGTDPSCGRLPVRCCVCSGRQCKKGCPVCLPVLPPQYGCCGRSGKCPG